MKVTFKDCTSWSMDGVTPRKYEEGEVVEVDKYNYDLLMRNDFVHDTGDKVIKSEKAMPDAPSNKMFDFSKVKTKKKKK